MELLLGAALLPLLLCGLMCAGGVLLAVVGLRRNDQSNGRDCCSTGAQGHEHAKHESSEVTL